MRALIAILLAGCGTLSSGPGAPTNEPSSGLGPATPVEDAKGLSWTPPDIFIDPATSYSHPSVLVSGKAIDLWVQSDQQGVVTIRHAHATTFDKGFGATDTVLSAALPWEAGAVGTPAILKKDETLLLYLAAGQLGVARPVDGARRSTPLFGGELVSMAAALDGDTVHVLTLHDGQVDERTCAWAALEAAVDGPAPSFTLATQVLPMPTWGTRIETLGLRIDKTPVGRMREDVFFSAELPLAGSMIGVDLGTSLPTSAGAASRYLDGDTSLAVIEQPILAGPPYPADPTAIAYEGGVLVFYTAPSTRTAIAVARHP